jgi:hypothetical protein
MLKISLSLICLIFVLLFSACPQKIKIFPSDEFTIEARGKRDATLAKMERNRQIWREKRIENYGFSSSYHGGTFLTTFPEAKITVRQGRLISMEKTSNDYPSDFSDFQKQSETVEKAFDAIKQALDDDLILEAKYHEKMGYPQEVKIIYSHGVDNWAVFYIENFEILE